MKFRVTSITGSEEGKEVSAITVELEDALNVELSNKSYGSNLDQVTIIVVTAFESIEENKRWAEQQNKLAHITNEFTNERIRHLSIGVPIRRVLALGCPKQQLQLSLVQAISEVLAVRPKRVAAGLDYEELSAAMRSTLAKATQEMLGN